jgi:glycosyltransferase involved in cell wall biosynthesis
MGGLPGPLESLGGRLRLVSMVHHPLADETGVSPDDAQRLAASERRALATCRGVIVSSEFTAGVLEGYGVDKEHVRVVVPGTQPVAAATGPAPGEPPVLLSVASVTPRKGYDVLVAALEQVRDLDWSCVCVGSTDRDRTHAHAVLRLVADGGLADRITFVGEHHGDHLARLYRGASIFVSASHYEGYGMALAEALAYGLPVVSTTGGAIPFTVPSAAGLLVEPGDADAFADALRTILAPDAATRERLSEAARQHASGLPDWRDAAAAFAAAVTELTR